jgi:DNA-binding beta-propeller fold protein YncE
MIPGTIAGRRSEMRGAARSPGPPRAAAGALLTALALALTAAGPTDAAAAHPSPPAPAGSTAHASIGFEPIPLSLATDSFGHLYMTNVQSMPSIYRYSDDGALLARWGHFEPSSAFVGRGIATDAAGDLWVADEAGGKVVEFGTDGGVLRSWNATRDGAIAVGPNGDVYLLNRDEVERFTPDGTLIGKWGSKNNSDGKFAEAYGIATGPNGDVYVADTWGNRVEVFDAEGGFLRSFGSYGHGMPGNLSTPYGIAVAPTSGDVYLADASDDQVVEFSAEGAFIRAWGKPGPRAGQFYTPTAVAVDPAGDIYVADAGEEYPDDGYARVQKFTGEGKFIAQWGEVPALRAKLTHRTTNDGAVFRFISGQRGARFECRLRGPGVPKKLSRWNQRCSSPKRYGHLAPGRKVFEVWTVLGHRTSGATRYTWNVPAAKR